MERSSAIGKESRKGKLENFRGRRVLDGIQRLLQIEKRMGDDLHKAAKNEKFVEDYLEARELLAKVKWINLEGDLEGSERDLCLAAVELNNRLQSLERSLANSSGALE